MTEVEEGDHRQNLKGRDRRGWFALKALGMGETLYPLHAAV